MTRSALARRYARGLLDAVLEADAPGESPEQVAEQIGQLSATVERFSDLELLLRNPAIGGDKKGAVMIELAQKIGATPITQRFVAVLAGNERLGHLPEIVTAYRELVDEDAGVINAEITTPQELDTAAMEALRTKLADATGRQVRLQTRIDSEVLGGLVTRIGDVLYDGSLRHQLVRMRSRMMES
jgi:F-type H+-transporting ATPase subunit delta